jgi:hypothetical protein
MGLVEMLAPIKTKITESNRINTTKFYTNLNFVLKNIEDLCQF